MSHNSDFWDFLGIAIIVFVVLTPPRWDPAIRLKEWTERKRLEREETERVKRLWDEQDLGQ